MSEFLLRHSNLSLTKLDQVDKFLRKLGNHKIGGLPLTKDVFNIRAKDSGFGMYALHDRYHICKIANLGHLLSSDIGGMMRKIYITSGN
jgi:hypothetical protein